MRRILCGSLLILGSLSGPALLLLWAFYLSLTLVGQVFLSYQWDILLLETGFLAVFLAPVRLWPRLRQEAPPSRTLLRRRAERQRATVRRVV